MRLLAATIVIGVLLAGCAETAPRPGAPAELEPAGPRVEPPSAAHEPVTPEGLAVLALDATRAPQGERHVVKLRATLTNVGGEDVVVQPGHGCEGSIDFVLETPEARVVPERPCDPRDAKTTRLPPGARLVVERTFDGTAAAWPGLPEPAVEGNHVALAKAHWHRADSRSMEPEQEEVRFHWSDDAGAAWWGPARPQQGPARLVVEVNRTTGGPEAPIRVTATLTNVGDAPIRWSGPGCSARFAFTLTDVRGNEQPLGGQAGGFCPDPRPEGEPLAPGASVEQVEFVRDDAGRTGEEGLAPGAYLVEVVAMWSREADDGIRVGALGQAEIGWRVDEVDPAAPREA